jgi:hypothetical protein
MYTFEGTTYHVADVGLCDVIYLGTHRGRREPCGHPLGGAARAQRGEPV